MTIWREWLADSWLHPRFINRIYMKTAMRDAATHASGLLVDIGCGRRPYEQLFRGRVRRYIGVDWPTHRSTARADVVADALCLPFQQGVADTVLLTEVIEHTARPDQCVREACHALIDGGVLIVSAPFLEPVHEQPRDFYRFTRYGIAALLERNGVSVRRLTPRGGWWSVVVGSFAGQALYELANPTGVNGDRVHPVRAALVLPLCALLQLAAYCADLVIGSEKYSLGHVAVGERSHRTP